MVFSLSKVNFENSYGFTVNGQKFRFKHAVQAQNILRHIAKNAESIGMVINGKKTAMLCTLGALEYKAEVFLYDERIGCVPSIKALGVRFSDRLDMELQVQHIVKAFRTTLWTLRNLKTNGFSTEELVKVLSLIHI